MGRNTEAEMMLVAVPLAGKSNYLVRYLSLAGSFTGLLETLSAILKDLAGKVGRLPRKTKLYLSSWR